LVGGGVGRYVALGPGIADGRSGSLPGGHNHTGAIGFKHNPVIFVHGFAGSGAQFDSQQMRLTSNGYPERYIFVFEYDSPLYAARLASKGPIPQEHVLFAQMDRLIAHVKTVTHHRKVDLLAHSLGTPLMQDYLNSSRQRAANVAHYVNIDGATANHPPGGVPTLALWGTKGPISQPPGRRIKGAKNVDIPDSSHVQTATSPRSFITSTSSSITARHRRQRRSSRRRGRSRSRGETLTSLTTTAWPAPPCRSGTSTSAPAIELAQSRSRAS
jgi:pimeloyl-ACP methyl ester carboxylesterase